MTNNAYIHIPFCKQKCKYCSFISSTNISQVDTYIEALKKDIRYHYQDEKLNTLYFGGGTPSIIDVKHLKKIIDLFKFSNDCEITLEFNPDDMENSYLKSLYNIGINRLSIGVQTFDDRVLKLIGRRHNSQQVIKLVELAKSIGFKNISIDLIYGLPYSNVKKDLERLKSLEIQHISTYGLKIEKESYWGKLDGKNLPKNLPDDDMQADMYLQINEFLEKNGYQRYEISNFALPNYESRHNLNYWNNSDYYGFGLGSHGYEKRVRYSNSINLSNYLLDPLKHENEHIQTQNEIIEEEIFLGFRKTAGINTEDFRLKFGFEFESRYKKILNKFLPEYIEKTNQGYRLTLKGILLSNNILSEFLE